MSAVALKRLRNYSLSRIFLEEVKGLFASKVVYLEAMKSFTPPRTAAILVFWLNSLQISVN
jgi:hypothetical protein